MPSTDNLEFQSFGNTAGYAAPPPSVPPGPEPHAPEGRTYPIWSIEYYMKYFDVDTTQVLNRMMRSVLPVQNFFEYTASNPDLYGPFWISTTVIFVMFVTGSMSGSITSYINGSEYDYDFTKLTFASVTVYTYVVVLSLIIWGTMKYFKVAVSFLEVLCLYGYSMTIFIPAALLCIIPLELSRWIIVAAAFGVSCFFLVRNMWSAIRQSGGRVANIMLLVMIAAHAGLALAFKLVFFEYVDLTSDSDSGNSTVASVSPTPSASLLTSILPSPSVSAGPTSPSPNA